MDHVPVIVEGDTGHKTLSDADGLLHKAERVLWDLAA